MAAKKKKNKSLQKFRRHCVYLAVLFIRRIMLLLPFRMSFALLGALGRAAYYLAPGPRRVTLKNLEASLGKEKSPEERRRIAREVFRNAGRNLAEVLCWPKLGEDHLKNKIEVRNLEIVEKALARGKGIIALTGHIGNWEYLAAWMALVGGYPFSVVARRYSNPELNRLLEENRRSMGLDVLYRGEGGLTIVKRLKKGQALGVLADQHIRRGEGIYVDFFGAKAKTLKNLAELIRKTGASVIPLFIIRNKDLTTHTIIIENPLAFPLTGNKDEDQKIISQTYTDAIESFIRKYPGQWMWMHHRWGKKRT